MIDYSLLANRYGSTRASSTGRLKVEVFASDGAIPVKGAKIRVFDKENNKTVEELTTNESGQTTLVNVQTPPTSLTEQPETTERPYNDLNVEVVAEGYDTVTIEGVQVFGDTTAFQRADLTSQKKTNNIVIEEHTLWGDYPPKIAEEEKKPVNDASGFVVLDKPVIPGYIVVHNGKPLGIKNKLIIKKNMK